MKIVSIHVQAFGKLSGVNLQLKDGVNVIQNVNGFGKTTMASFIRAMLYGFTYKTVGGVKDNARFAPWQGTGRFGGSIVVEHDGETYRIERFFGSTQRQETLTVTNEKTGKPLNLNEMQPGEFFLGLTAESYDRSAYFPQEAVELSSNDNFDSRLANLIENGADDYDKIQDRLRAYKKNLRFERGNGGVIYELDCKKRDLLQKQNEAQRAEHRAADIDRYLAQIEQEQRTLKEELSQEIEKAKQQPKPQPLQAQQPQPQQAQSQPQPVAKGYDKLLLYFGIALALVGVVFLALGAAQVITDVVAFGVSAGCLALAALSIAGNLVLKRRAKSQSDVQQIEQQTEQSTEQVEVAQNSREQDILERLNALAVNYGRLTEERKSLTFDSVAIEDELLNVANERAEAQFRYEVADTVSQLLAQAKDNLSSSYLPKLTARCSELLAQITDSNYSVVVDRSFNVKIREQGQTRDMSSFSRGIREVTLLCFRVALSELLYDGQIPFIIIDDAFVNFDENNFARATGLLRKLSAHAQVVYFTCHNRMGQLLK